MVRHKTIKVVGYGLFGLIVTGLVMTVIAAWIQGRPFIGENFYGLPIGTYSTAAVMVLVVLIGIVWLNAKAIATFRRRRSG
jgi:polyferredoxin